MRSFLFSVLWLFGCFPSLGVVVEKFTFLDHNEAYYVHQDLPVVSLQLYFKGGVPLDPQGKEGRALFTVSLLNEGAGSYSAKDFDRKLDELASVMSFSAEGNGLTVTVKCLEKKIEETLELLALCLFEPRFDTDAVDRVREQMYTMLKEQSVDPSTMASKQFATLQYPNHPFSRFPTKESVEKLNVEDFKTYMKRQMGRNLLTVGCVSSLSKEKMAGLLTKTLQPLAEKVPEVDVPKVVSKDPGGINVVNVDRPQTVCIFGHRGIEREHPDYYPALILNGVLGGVAFTSRLFKKVREEKGLTYGIYTNLSYDDYTTELSGSVSTDNKRFAETYSLIRSVWSDLQKDGPTQEEVKLVKDYLTGSFALNFQSSLDMAGALVSIQRNKLGLDYFESHLEKIKSVTFDQVKKVAHELLHPVKLTFVAVGNPKDIVTTPGKGAA